MTTFDEREKAFEAKFVHDADLQFRVEARRNKLLGLWAAELLSKSGEEATAYAMSVVEADFEEAGPDDVLRKLSADLGDKATLADLKLKLSELAKQAYVEVMTEV